MTGTNHVIPLLLEMCAAIDTAFVEETGPFGQMLCADARAAWIATGNKLKPADVVGYVRLLAAEIDEPARRAAFVARALALIGMR